MKKLMLLLAIMGLGLCAAPVAAQTTEVERLQAELRRLRNEVDALNKVQRGGEGEDPALKTTLKNSVFSWATEDGKFSLTMASRVQFRVTYNDERGQDVDSGDGAAARALSTNGRDFWNFKVARLETWFIGNIFEKEFKYYVEFAWAAGGDNIVQEAYFTWARWQEFNINVGQTKTPYSWQFLVSSGRQQFVERSTVSAVFDQFYAKGLWFSGQIGKETPWLKYWAGVFNGALRANNDFRNADRALRVDTFSSTVDADLMPVIRLETHPLGETARDHTDQRSREESKKIRFSVGLGFAWFISRFANAAVRPTPGGLAASPGSGRSNTGQDTLNVTLDGHFKFYGLSVNIEWHHRHTEFHNFGPLEGNNVFRNRNAPGDLTDNGFLFEAGFMILPKQFDVAFRFGMVDADEFWLGGSSNKPNGIIPDSTEIGIGVGYYIAGHNMKILADFTYTSYQLVVNAGTVANLATMGNPPPTRSASSIANDNSDYLNVWQFRIQFAWVF